MADQSNIDDAALQIATLVNKAREELTQDLYYLGLQADDLNAFASGILSLDIEGTLRTKLTNATTIFANAHRGVLETTIGFAEIDARSLVTFAQLNEQVFDQTVINTISSHIKTEVIKGVQAGIPVRDVLDIVAQSSISESQIETLVTTSLNDYSRTVTNQMMDLAPANTKYVYIGPADEKTRPECLQYIREGKLTKKEIEAKGWGETFVKGGGFNCRHKWEIASEVGTSFYEGKEAAEGIPQ